MYALQLSLQLLQEDISLRPPLGVKLHPETGEARWLVHDPEEDQMWAVHAFKDVDHAAEAMNHHYRQLHHVLNRNFPLRPDIAQQAIRHHGMGVEMAQGAMREGSLVNVNGQMMLAYAQGIDRGGHVPITHGYTHYHPDKAEALPIPNPRPKLSIWDEVDKTHNQIYGTFHGEPIPLSNSPAEAKWTPAYWGGHKIRTHIGDFYLSSRDHTGTTRVSFEPHSSMWHYGRMALVKSTPFGIGRKAHGKKLAQQMFSRALARLVAQPDMLDLPAERPESRMTRQTIDKRQAEQDRHQAELYADMERMEPVDRDPSVHGWSGNTFEGPHATYRYSDLTKKLTIHEPGQPRKEHPARSLVIAQQIAGRHHRERQYAGSDFDS